jgi:hypothetical protein
MASGGSEEVEPLMAFYVSLLVRVKFMALHVVFMAFFSLFSLFMLLLLVWLFDTDRGVGRILFFLENHE